MSSFDDFEEIVQFDYPLAQQTWLKVGGPAQVYAEPRTVEELRGLITIAEEESLPVRLLGGGSNLLVRDEGVSGLVIHLKGEPFETISVDGAVVRAGGAAALSSVVSAAVGAGLAGLATLVGIPGTLGGAIKGNSGSRYGEIGQFVTSVDVLTVRGEQFTRSGDELTFEYRFSSVNELVVLGAELTLKPGNPEELARRMRQIWITKKATQPFSFQSAGCIFKNPRGLSAGVLIEKAGMKGTRVGNAEVSDRHANFIIAHEDATSADILNLIDLVRGQVHEKHGIELELEIKVW